jgi:hypothetical protein
MSGGIGSRPGETNLVQPRGQGALPSGMAMQPWWTGSGLGAVSPAVVAPGSGAGISLSSNPLGGGAAKGAHGKAVDDARAESSEDSRRSGEPRGLFSFTSTVQWTVFCSRLVKGSFMSSRFTLVLAINLLMERATSSDTPI